jgi:hypothetical protein
MKYTYYKIHLKLPDAENNKCNYVGMTTNFNVRKAQHKSACNNENDKRYNTPIYQHIRANGGWGAWCVEPLEVGEYNTRLEASKRERFFYEQEGGELNYQVPARELKEYLAGYYDIKKDEILEQQKEYRAANKEHIQQYKKEYAAANKGHIQQYQREYRQQKKAAQN